jgi:hypothetical protein
MNIKSVKKQKDQFNNETNVLYVITEDDVVTFVPTDQLNTDYQAIQEWLAEGNTIEDAD